MKSWEMAQQMARARKLLGEGTLLRLQVFSEIAAAGSAGIEQGALSLKCGSGGGTISTNVHGLSSMTHLKQPGPGLVHIRVNPSNLRVNIVTLTDKGEAVARELFS